jgi:hypothetical protein
MAKWRPSHAPEEERGERDDGHEIDVEARGAPDVHPQHGRARHAGDPVLGPNECVLERHGIEHLGEGESEHDEVHAADANAEIADQEGSDGGGRGGQEERGGEAGRLDEGKGGRVGTDAEEGRMTEGHHARVPHQEVEAHGEDAEDQDLLQQLHRVCPREERKDGDGGGQDDESSGARDHRRARPKSPCGRNRRMRAITA